MKLDYVLLLSITALIISIGFFYSVNIHFEAEKFVPNLFLSPKQKFNKFISNYDGSIYQETIQILSIEYEIPEGLILHYLKENGFWRELYKDELCSFYYFINDEKNYIEPMFFDIPEGKLTFIGMRFDNPLNSPGWFIP